MVGGQQRTRAEEGFEDLVFGEVLSFSGVSSLGGKLGVVMYRESATGPQWSSYDLALSASPAIPFPVNLRDSACALSTRLGYFA